MDFGNAPKMTPVGGPPVVSRSDVVATHGSVAVELPPEQTVQSAQAGDAVRLDVRARSRNPQAQEALTRDTQARDRQARDTQARDAQGRDAQTRGDQDRDVQDRASFDQFTAADRQQRRQTEQNQGDVVQSRLVIEPRTRTVVLEKKDQRTGETVSQLPDETLLKLRIYSRELTERAQEVHDARGHEIERIA